MFLIWGLDYLTGPELSTSIFYLLPIAAITWVVNKRYGFALSFISTAAWLINDLVTNPFVSHPLVPYWNAVVRLGFFLIVTYALSSLRSARERQEELSAFVVHDLRSPLGNMLSALDLLQQTAVEDSYESNNQLIEMAITSCAGSSHYPH